MYQLARALIVTAMLFSLPVLVRLNAAAGPAASARPEAIRFQTSLDDQAAISNPAVGLGGSSSLQATDFVAAQVNNGVYFVDSSKVITFPVSNGTINHLSFSQGEVSFWYRPDYAANADDVEHHLWVVGNIYNPPYLLLSEGDRLRLRLVDAGFNSYEAAAPYRADLWPAGSWVQLRAVWQAAAADPIQLYVDGVRVDEGGAPGGWNLGNPIDFTAMFVGAANGNGDFSALGIIDEFVIREDLAGNNTPSSTATATGSGPTATPSNSPTATATSDQPPTATPGPTPAIGISDPNLVVTPAPLPNPALGVAISNPNFGGTVRRLTDRAASGNTGTHIYSQLQAFSPDSNYVLLAEDGFYVVRQLESLSQQTLNTGTWNAPRWQPALPHTIIHYDSNDDTTLRVELTDVETLQTSTVFTFPASYQRIRGNQSFDELSHDGRWMAGMATRSDGTPVIFALDLQNNMLGAELVLSDIYSSACQPDPQYGNLEPDWVGMSPLGTYLMVQWVRDGTERCSGLESFDPQSGAFVGRAYEGHQHGDLGLDSNGREFFMTYELSAPPPNNGRPAIGLRELPGNNTFSPPEYLQVIDWFAGHISCQGPAGACLVSTIEDDQPGTWSPFEAELFLQYTDGRVLRLGHHRSSSCGYWVQPRASMSADGRYLIFASDWYGQTGQTGCNGNAVAGDAYLIDLGNTNQPATATPTSQANPTATPSLNTFLYLPLVLKTQAAPTPPTPTAANSPTATTTPTNTASATPTATATATSAPDAATFSEQNIDSSRRHGQGISAIDMDGDSDLDVLAAYSLNDTLILYQNNGAGNNWTPIPLTSEGTIVAMMPAPADLDGDGDLDVAAVGLFERDCGAGNFCITPGEVTWFEHPGDLQGTWTAHSVDTALWGARFVSAGDLTGDGRPDLVVGTTDIGGGNGLYWYRNSNNGATWSTPITLQAAAEVNSVVLHDVDGDQVTDILFTDHNSNEVVWLENSRMNGNVLDTPTFTRHTLATLTGPSSLTLANTDTDPALEALVSSAAGTFWLDPPANPTEVWSATPVVTDFGTGNNDRAAAADFDLDGDADVAVMDTTAAALRWYENRNGSWIASPLTGDTTGISFLLSADLNSDGRPDLLSTTYENTSQSDNLSWWRNSP